MADEDRDTQNAQLFRGTPARGEVFDSVDSIVSMDDLAPPDAAPARPAPVQPAAVQPAAVQPAPVQPAAVQPAATTASPAPGADPEDGFDDVDTVANAGALGPDLVIDDDPRPVRTVAVTAARAPDDAPPTLRRRLLTVGAIVLAALGTFLLIFPFEVTSGSVTAKCGPPVFEVVVPADPAFDVPENTLCQSPALHRVIVGGILVLAFLAISFSHRWQSRARLRHARRARRQRARAARHAGGRDEEGSARVGPVDGARDRAPVETGAR